MKPPGRLTEVCLIAARKSWKVGRNRVDAWVEGPSVFVRIASTVRELPRAACELIYDVSEPKATKAKGKS